MHDLPILRSIPQLRSRLRSWRAFGETVAIVPIGSVLHEGQLSLLRSGRREADRVLAVVVPTPGRDVTPDEESLAELADEAEADALYLPSTEDLCPADTVTVLNLPGMTDVLCGEDQPDRLGVFARVMTRLFNHAQADSALFGERDWQRVAIMRRVAADLGLPTEVKAAPTERDADGIALGGGVETLEGRDRAAAAKLWRVLLRAASEIAEGGDVDAALDAAADALADAGAEVEYLEMRDEATLAERSAHDPVHPARIFAAIGFGDVRIIDNVRVGGADDVL